jgi:hypothetical protein
VLKNPEVKSEEIKKTPETILQKLKQPNLLLLYLTNFCVMFAFTGMEVCIGILGADYYGLTSTYLGVILGVSFNYFLKYIAYLIDLWHYNGDRSRRTCKATEEISWRKAHGVIWNLFRRNMFDYDTLYTISQVLVYSNGISSYCSRFDIASHTDIVVLQRFSKRTRPCVRNQSGKYLIVLKILSQHCSRLFQEPATVL